MSLIWITIIFYFGILIYSIIYACIKLNEPGISNEVRKLVLLRHVMTMLTFMIVNLYKIVGACIAFMPRFDGELPEIDNVYVRIAKILRNCEGFILPL